MSKKGKSENGKTTVKNSKKTPSSGKTRLRPGPIKKHESEK